MDLAIRRRRAALFLFFFIIGICNASWVTRTPAIRDSLTASIAEMGLVLFGLSIGSMAGVLAASRAVQRFGRRPVIAVGITGIMAGVAIIAPAAALSSTWGVAAGLLLFGVGMGLSDIAINIDGSDVERRAGRPILAPLHGCYSLGTVVGALIGLAMTAISFPVLWHLLLVVIPCVPAALWAIGAVPSHSATSDPKRPVLHDERHARPGATQVWRDPRLFLIGLIVLAMALAEGSASDWLPLLMVDGHGFDPASGSLIYAGFAAAMTVGRFAGGYFLQRHGRVVVVRASTIAAAAGIAMVIFSNTPLLAALSVVLWGLGASLAFPISISAAGDSGPDPAARVGAVATTGYFAFLVGPPLLGFLGDAYGLRQAMIVVLVLVIGAFFLAPAVRGGRAGRVLAPSTGVIEPKGDCR